MAPTDRSSNRAADRPNTLPCLTLKEIRDSAWGRAAVPQPTHTHQSFARHSCMYSREMGWAFAFAPFPVYQAFRISPKLFPVLPNYQALQVWCWIQTHIIRTDFVPPVSDKPHLSTGRANLQAWPYLQAYHPQDAHCVNTQRSPLLSLTQVQQNLSIAKVLPTASSLTLNRIILLTAA